MKEPHIDLSPSEWQVMECLWEKSPKTGRELTAELEEKMDWNRSTTLTLLRRMEAKGTVRGDSSGAVRQFYPAFAREDAALQETEDFLHRVYHGSLSMMVSAMTRKQAVSKKELDELYEMLQTLEGGTSHD